MRYLIACAAAVLACAGPALAETAAIVDRPAVPAADHAGA